MPQDPTLGDLDPGSALNHNQLARPDGVLAPPGSSDCRVSVDSGTLGANDTLAVESGSIRIGGTVVDIPAQPVGVPAVGGQPRKDLVVGGGDGTASVVTGTPETAQYSRLVDEADRVLEKAYRPSPPDAAALDGVVLAVVLVVPGDALSASASVDGDANGPVPDRRSFVLEARVDAQAVHTSTIDANEQGEGLSLADVASIVGSLTDGTELDSVTGTGLSIDSNNALTSSDTNTQAFTAVESGGPVALNGSDEVVIDTGRSTAGGGHYFGTADVPSDMDYAVSTHRDDSGTGNWQIHVEQNTTSITAGDIDWVLWKGNP